jgi:hypothetical protein
MNPRVPYIFSLHFGVVAAALAIFAIRSRPRWATLAGALLAVAWAAGHAGDVTRLVGFGFFRFPQKLIFPFTIAAALLAGWGLERALAHPRAARRVALAGGALVAAAIALRLLFAPLRELVRGALARDGDAALAAAGVAGWIAGAAISGVVLLAAAIALRRTSAAGLAGAQLLALLPLAPLVVTEPRAALGGTPPLAAAISPPETVVAPALLDPPWESLPQVPVGAEAVSPRRYFRLALFPAFGVPAGLAYPLAPDLEGLTSPLSLFVQSGLGGVDPAARVGLLRRFGVGWIAHREAAPPPGTERAGVFDDGPFRVALDRVEHPAPRARWPESVVVAGSPVEAFLRIVSGVEAGDVAIASRAVAHLGGAEVDPVSERPDRLVVDVRGGGGLLVLQRAWLPLYRARLADGTALRTQPVEVALLGVEVPAGERRVEISISSAPEKIAAAIASIVVAALLFEIGRGKRRRAIGAEA